MASSGWIKGGRMITRADIDKYRKIAKRSSGKRAILDRFWLDTPKGRAIGKAIESGCYGYENIAQFAELEMWEDL